MNCPVCGAELPQEALFCGECGSSVTAKPKTRPLVRDPRPSDTTVLDPLPAPAMPGPMVPGPMVPDPPVPLHDVVEPADVPAAPPADAPTGPPSRVAPAPTAHVPTAYEPPAYEPLAPEPLAPVSSAPVSSAHVPPSPPAETDDEAPAAFTLRMSTGERIVVSGTGLIGRRPIAQPGEHFDQLVSVADSGRSVSKTHLEYGIQFGELWVSDRYSANGTSIVDASGIARRCEPGRRYRVPRGARVEIGDQHIDVG